MKGMVCYAWWADRLRNAGLSSVLQREDMAAQLIGFRYSSHMMQQGRHFGSVRIASNVEHCFLNSIRHCPGPGVRLIVMSMIL